MRVSRRVVALGAAAALVLSFVTTSAASAVTGSSTPKTVEECAGQTPPMTDALIALCLGLLAAKNGPDYTPRDMAVAAPSSVIAATSSETPERRVQEVSRWRPNSQAFIDAKARLAQASGLTADQLDSVGRWAPKVAKGLGVAGVLTGDSLIAAVVRDGVLKPQLDGYVSEDLDGMLRNTYCSRHGNFATDWLTGFVVSGCPEWRLKADYLNLVNQSTFSPMTGALVGGFGYSISIAVFTHNGRSMAAPCGHVTPHGEQAPGTINYTIRLQDGTVIPKSTYILDVGSAVSYDPSFSCSSPFGHAVGNFHTAYGSPIASVSQITIKDQAGDVVDTAVEKPADVEWLTRVRCLDGGTVSAVSDSFQQSALGAVAVPASVQLAGCQPVGVDVGIQKAGRGTSGAGGGWSSVPTNDGSPVSVGSSEVPTAVQDWETAFPDCWDGSCLLELRKVIGGSMELDCFDAPDQCLNWSTEVAAQPDTYRCYYGGQLVAITECNVYTRVFDRDKVQQGTGYADPATGEKVTTSTGTAATTNPGASTQAMSSAVQDPSKSRDCFPNGWAAFNPFEWVLQPVKCALEWAFVPRESAFQSFQANLSGRFSSTSFGAVAGVVTAINVPGVGDGCTGPPLSFKYGEIDETWYPFSACDAPMAGVAATIKLWLGFLITAGAVFAIIRYVTAIIGFIPYGGGSSAGGRRGPRFEAGDE